MAWLYLMVAVAAEVVATAALKASDGFSKLGPSLAVLVGYGTAFFFLSLTLKSIPMGVAYAVWAGAGIVLISIVGWVAFGQKLDLAGFAGIGLIGAGVVVLNVFSKAAAH